MRALQLPYLVLDLMEVEGNKPMKPGLLQGNAGGFIVTGMTVTFVNAGNLTSFSGVEFPWVTLRLCVNPETIAYTSTVGDLLCGATFDLRSINGQFSVIAPTPVYVPLNRLNLAFTTLVGSEHGEVLILVQLMGHYASASPLEDAFTAFQFNDMGAVE